jgi:hypothetical protein
MTQRLEDLKALIAELTLEDVVADDCSFIWLSNLINDKHNTLNREYYGSYHYREVQAEAQRVQDKKRRWAEKRAKVAADWARDNLKVGDWISLKRVTYDKYRRVSVMGPTSFTGLRGDPLLDKTTPGNAISSYSDIDYVFDPETKRLVKVQFPRVSASDDE